ncbi:exodeoxyribonuclease III [Taklimakanibacter albus]|uniref:Exodeoxyribonuclease III n=1 Tax=Taklimakanibacter albus TaxID=2800327 RepID=A0ACC5R1W4_9HYPH|nr:exodeoxyribonuclease III [Aestuariivirga sp. YIM B02566]MBK1866635.1 exodeoxyribonuclease III [Aestuariivirga sp. YIM B02566]
MLIATWNVNSVKARLETVIAWLKEASPDVVCFQELKCEDKAFPAQAFEELGYNLAVHGQKTYNGVAILSKLPFDEVRTRLPGDDGDEQARYVEAVVSGIRVASIYLPNGNPVASEKYAYKLSWMDRLITHTKGLLAYEEPFVLAGDYNVIPQAIDAKNPADWVNDALFLPPTLAKFRELINLGLTDAVRTLDPEPGLYTFWDYQAGAWQKNNGIRIDHLLLSPQAADRLQSTRIDKHVRAWEKPSDHVPVLAQFGA